MKTLSLFVPIIVLVFQVVVFAQVVEIPDPNLRKALETTLKINPGQEITKEALAELVSLIAQNSGITDLSGLEHCTNLTGLYLNNNQLTDLNGLANVNLSKLTKLALNNNQISDISLLANLTDLTVLTVLNLANNRLTNLNGLANANLPNLNELYLNNNQLTDLNELANANFPKLIGLYLANNQLTDLNGLANANLSNLTWLYLNNNQLRNINPLSNLTKITELNIRGQPLNADAYTKIIPVLKARGVNVLFDANTPPVAHYQAVTLDQGGTKAINLLASDADRDTLTYTVVSQPRNGTLSGNTFNLIYTPNVVFFGTDSFTFKVNDGTFYSAEAMVSITVKKFTVANIPDPNLRSALKLVLRISSDQEITKEMLAGLVNLIAQSREITNLDGLGYCTNLTKLYLANNQLIDLNGLANANLPNLTELYLNNNQLTDLNGLANANLPNLTVLNLANNQLTDLHGLTNAKLPNLTSLHLYDNQLTDLNGLTNANLPNLTVLYLNNNRISNISLISNLTNLTTLWLYNNQISDISPLIANTGIKSTIKLKGNPLNNKSLFTHVPIIEAKGIGIEYDMPKDVVMFKDSNLEKAIREALGIPTKLLKKEDLAKLEKLEAENKKISDLTALEHCTNLAVLYLNNNQISDIRPLANADLVKLTVLYLANNQLTNLNGLANAKLPNLTSLHLNNNRLTDLNGLANVNLPKLTKLTLNNNQISNVNPLATLTNLTALHLNENQLIDLNGLANADLSKLTVLYLANNQLTDLNGLAKADLSKLTELYLNNNRLTNLSGLVNAKLPSLAGLYLYDNQLTDLNDLANLSNLTKLYSTNNQLTDLNGLANLTSLTVLYLPNNQISNINAISNLINLTTLWLYNNQINDISPLIANTGIKGTIKLRKNPLNNTSLSTHIPVMEARGIRVEYDELPKGIIKMSDSGFEASLRQALTLPTKVITQTNVIGITNLDLANTGVIGLDVEALKMFPELEVIILTDNPLSRDAVLVKIPLLETTGIKVNLGTSEVKLVTLSVDNPQIPASKAEITTVTVAVKDKNGRLVKREVVTMATDKGEIETTADNQGDGTYIAAYTSTDTVGETEITAVTGNGVVGTIKLKLIETVVSAKKSKVTVSAAPKIGETVTVDVVLFSEEDLVLSGKEVSLKISPMEGIAIENDTV